MSDDRELLELAARAAGIDGEYLYSHRGGGGAIYAPAKVVEISPTEQRYEATKGWNPLKDDADAFKLATSLGISVLPCPIYNEPKHSALAVKKRLFPMPEDSAIEIYGDDPCAATRRAIVRIAANLARG